VRTDVEQRCGSLTIAAFFLASAIGGAAYSCLGNDTYYEEASAVGLSGGVCSLVGLTIADYYSNFDAALYDALYDRAKSSVRPVKGQLFCLLLIFGHMFDLILVEILAFYSSPLLFFLGNRSISPDLRILATNGRWIYGSALAPLVVYPELKGFYVRTQSSMPYAPWVHHIFRGLGLLVGWFWLAGSISRFVLLDGSQ